MNSFVSLNTYFIRKPEEPLQVRSVQTVESQDTNLNISWWEFLEPLTHKAKPSERPLTIGHDSCVRVILYAICTGYQWCLLPHNLSA